MPLPPCSGQDVPFGVFVAVLTLAAHSFFRPYVDDDDDRLHFSVLLGHFFIMYGMYLVRGRSEEESGCKVHLFRFSPKVLI